MRMIKIKFFIKGGDLNFDEITKKLDITPNKVRKKEEFPSVVINMGGATDLWMFCIEDSDCKAISKQLDKMQCLFMSKMGSINELREEYSFKISIEVVIKSKCGEQPEILLSTENIKFLADLNADIGFDLYIDE